MSVSSSRTPRPPAKELDLPLKLAMRRVFWGMNYATRLNLKLALPAGSRSEELTDLDCVAFSTGADFSIRMLVADCKSGQKVSPASRAFWLAGARDYVGADRAYLVLQRQVPDAVRELAANLSLDLLGESDRTILENVHGQHAPNVDMFEIEGAMRVQGLLSQLDKRLERLNRFREHDYWHLPAERRLQRLIVELRTAAPSLKPDQLSHRVLVLDLMFLFAVALLNACRHVSAVSLSDPREALLQYLLGGPALTRERRQQLGRLRASLEELHEAGAVPRELVASTKLEPDYFDSLAETVARLLRRPRDAQRILRYVEWWAHAHEGIGAPSAPEALGQAYGAYTQKLVSDMTRTCFAAAKLDKRWMAIANGAGAMPQPDDRDREATAADDPREFTESGSEPAKGPAHESQLPLDTPE